LWLLLDHRASSLEFLGVYATEFPNKEDANNIPNGEDNVPSFCIRKSLWNRSEDIANCQLADNKEEYIIGKKQTFSQVIFINSRQVPKLTELILEVVEITKNGLKLQENIYKQSPYNEIKIYISEGSFDLNFAYKPYLMTNSLLEEWIIKWRNCIDGLPINIGYSPDEQFRMSYELSLFDQIQLFSEIQR
jgi:hypothetical protein